jgi:hypothetical protein
MLRLFIILMALASSALTASGEQSESPGEHPFITWHGELKAHYRWSEDSIFPLRFPFPPEFIPRGATSISERTVSPGSALEVSNAALTLDLNPGEMLTGRIRIHFGDLYNRNPTSTDQTVNLKEAWLLLGKRVETWQFKREQELYILFGKAPKFERQPERNLESYGLVSTAFNRFEDHQIQLGGSFGVFYGRFQLSSGNPVFFRDPNALAGDNGNDDLRFPNPELHLNSGFPILYDAEVEDVQSGHYEIGSGIGARLRFHASGDGLNLFVFYYGRDLAGRVDLRGTFYGGDLDLLDGTGGISLPIHGRRKKEVGGNLEAHFGPSQIFVQYVHQELAGLKRAGFEIEGAWRMNLPLRFAAGGKQLFTFVQPVFRLSLLENDFTGSPLFVAPSVFWDWRKIDLGIRLGVIQHVDLTTEYSFHKIKTSGPDRSLNEFLTTLRVRF